MKQFRTQVRSQHSTARNGVHVCYAVLGIATAWLAVTATWGYSATQADPGLRGIIPAFAPEGLSPDDFAALDGNWEQWGQETAALVAKLYEDENSDAAQQRDVINRLQAKIGVMDRALADSSYRSLFDPLTVLRGRLARRVGIANAILNTLHSDTATTHQQRLEPARQQLTSAIADLEKHLAGIPNGAAWLKYLRTQQVADAATSADGTFTVLSTVQSRLTGEHQAMTAEQRAFLRGERFAAYETALNGYLTALETVAAPTDHTALRAELTKLVESLESHESQEQSSTAAAVRQSYSALRKLAPDGGEHLTNALRTHYFNYNVRVVASERFVERYISESRRDDGPVDDCILGAKVDGWQCTITDVGVDMKTNNNGVSFDITLRGATNSNTQGVTEQATIFTSGYHNFWAAKEIQYNGDTFSTGPARISVNANNTTTGAKTAISGFPILGDIAESIAVGAARKKRPESEAIAASRVTDRVIPEFNSEVDEQFSKANSDLDAKLNGPLKEMGLYPSAKDFRSTNDALIANMRLMAAGELGGDSPKQPNLTSNGIEAHIHQSHMNNAIDKLNVAGKTMTEDELGAEIEKSFRPLLGDDFKFSKKDDAPADSKDAATLIFADVDPIRFDVEGGVLTLTIRAGLKQEDGKEDIPTQEIKVPLEFRVEGGNILITSGTIGVAPVERPNSLAVQIARAGIVRNKIKAALPDRQVDPNISIKREGREPMEVAITQIKALDGWMSIVLE